MESRRSSFSTGADGAPPMESRRARKPSPARAIAVLVRHVVNPVFILRFGRFARRLDALDEHPTEQLCLRFRAGRALLKSLRGHALSVRAQPPRDLTGERGALL